MSSIDILVVGGLETKFHDFSIMGSIFKDFLEEASFKVTLTQDLDFFLSNNIKKYKVIVCCTTGRELNAEQEKGLLNAIIGSPWGETGEPKTFIGVHGASCSFQNSQEYLRMLGGKFLTHPPLGEEYEFKVIKPNHPIMQGISDFSLKDELYLMEIYPPIKTLIVCDYKGFSRPISWIKPYGLGYVFYTALGHGEVQVKTDVFQKMIVNAIKWCLNRMLNNFT
ncbi:MAG: ThuA domain-containing protein [Promethearchaeota archaeon]